jgi:hypothetical protein
MDNKLNESNCQLCNQSRFEDVSMSSSLSKRVFAPSNTGNPVTQNSSSLQSQVIASTVWVEGMIQDSQDKLRVIDKASDILASAGNQAVNLVAIIGSARKGKSFLMNQLMQPIGLQCNFQVSHGNQPCTQGIHILPSLVPLIGVKDLKENISIGFVDSEGRGDKVGLSFRVIHHTQSHRFASWCFSS